MDTQAIARASAREERWPALPFTEWKDTIETLHMWSQIVGKVRLELSPYLNHWWQVPLYVTSRGLTTSPVPYRDSIFEVSFDFIDHNLFITTSDGKIKTLPLLSRPVADFYQDFMLCLDSLGIQVTINTLPSEVMNPIRCDEDMVHATYDPVYVNRFWRILVQTELALQQYRSRFIGKSSPIHFFWGSFDMALTFFSGKRAPEPPGADRITREAYSHEVISCGFWPGSESSPQAAYYAYVVPEPKGFPEAKIKPAKAFYNKEAGEFLLLYDDVRQMDNPQQALLDFFNSVYESGATLGNWDRVSLELRATKRQTSLSSPK